MGLIRLLTLVMTLKTLLVTLPSRSRPWKTFIYDQSHLIRVTSRSRRLRDPWYGLRPRLLPISLVPSQDWDFTRGIQERPFPPSIYLVQVCLARNWVLVILPPVQSLSNELLHCKLVLEFPVPLKEVLFPSLPVRLTSLFEYITLSQLLHTLHFHSFSFI